MFLKIKGCRGRRLQWNHWGALLLLFCFVYKPSKTSQECTSDHNILISQLCSLGCFNQGVFDNIALTPSLCTVCGPQYSDPPQKDSVQYRASQHHWERGLPTALQECGLIRRLPAPYEVKSWTLFQQPWLKMLQQPGKWNGFTDAIQIQRVAGRCAVLQTQTVGLHSVIREQ